MAGVWLSGLCELGRPVSVEGAIHHSNIWLLLLLLPLLLLLLLLLLPLLLLLLLLLLLRV